MADNAFMEFQQEVAGEAVPVLVNLRDIVLIGPAPVRDRAGRSTGEFEGTILKLRHEAEPEVLLTPYETVRDLIAALGLGMSLEEYRQWCAESRRD